MTSEFYDRTILTLEALRESEILSNDLLSILGSPLKLARSTILQSFDESGRQLQRYRDKLDSIKRMALGLSSAERSSVQGDKLASYGLYLYGFQQYFQSSIRARQGNVLDKALSKILKDNGINTYPKASHKKVQKELGIQTSAEHDVDVLGSLEEKYLIVQIRSRDDTGGTTAKGSLVELVRDISQTRRFPNKPLTYFIYVWEPLNRQQRESLINRIGDALELSESDKLVLSKGQTFGYGSNIDLKVVYGADELFEAVKSVFSVDVDAGKYAKLIDMLGQWDDLWLSYTLASLELENLCVIGITNFTILDELLKRHKISIKGEDLLDYRESSIKLAQKLAPAWNKDSICFRALSDQLNYVRDIVLLKMSYIALKKG